MTRTKVTLAYITNDADRKASYKKRKKGLLKKVQELTILCDVEACAVIYSPYDPEPVVWPSQEGAEAVMSRFRQLPGLEQTKKMVNQESYTRQRIKKAEDQLRRIQRENKRRHLECFMFQCLAGMASLDEFDVQDSAEMSWVVKQTLQQINSMLDDKPSQAAQASSSAPVQPPPPPILLPPPQPILLPPPQTILLPPPPAQPEAAYIPLPTTASPPLHQAAQGMMGDEEMENLFNMMESPTGVGNSMLGDAEFEWNLQSMDVLPYPHIFNHGADVEDHGLFN